MAKRLKKGRAWWMGHRGNGLRVRLKGIPGETSRHTLRRPVYFPAVMRGFGWSEEFSHSKFRTVERGEFSQPSRGRSIRTIDEGETLTLAYDPEWLTVNGIQPHELHRTLIRIGRAKEPVQLLARMEGAHESLMRMPVNLIGLSVMMRENEPDTLYYVWRFEEWRKLTSERKSKGRFPLNHFLDANDTLHSLSRKYYRSTEEWRTIAERNHVRKWGPNTPLVKMKRYKLGSKIVIPEPPPRAGRFVGIDPYVPEKQGPFAHVPENIADRMGGGKIRDLSD